MDSHMPRAVLPLALAATLLVPATSAAAESTARAPSAKPSAANSGPSFSLSGDHQDYSRGLGTKTMVTAVARFPIAPGTMVQLSAARGERAVGGASLRASGFSATIQMPLVPRLSSRTILSAGKAGPLFAARSAGEELSLKLGSTELRGGARLTRYAGGLDVRSAHAGLAHQAGPVRLDYGLAAYARKGALDGGLIHRFDGALNDFSGTTHLMLAAGSSLHEHDFRPDKVPGRFRFAGLKRKQKLGRGFAIELTGGWTAFDRPKGKYGAARIGAGLSFAP